MKDKRCIVTGANSGMGFHTSRQLAETGATVVMACRSREKGEGAAAKINAIKDISGKALFMCLDLASLDSVGTFAEEYQQKFQQLDLLICNAGIMAPPHSRTKDNYESQFQINYLGHFLLFNLLVDHMCLAESSRLVSISSLSSEKAVISGDDIRALANIDENDYDPMTAYRCSKLLQVIFAAEVSRRYGRQICSSAVHPGIVNTDLFYRRIPAIAKACIQPVAWLGYLSGFLKTARQGSATAVYLSTTEDNYENGRYWAEKKHRQPNPLMNDYAIGAKCWEESLRLCNLTAA